MKSFKLIALSAMLTIGAFSTVVYTSCSKDDCKDVTCNNGGTCTGGNCTCPSGYGGTSCSTIFRDTYANIYKGTATDNAGNTYSNFRLVFASTGSDVTKMSVTVQDATGGSAGVPVLTVDLTNNTTSGSTMTVESTTSGGYTYTGSGVISETQATLTLTEAGGVTTVYTFPAFTKQ